LRQKTDGLYLGYLRFFSRPGLVLLTCAVAAITGLVLGIGLFFYVGSEFWSSFEHVAAVVAVLGVLLALPALSYGVEAEMRLDQLWKEIARVAPVEEPAEVERKMVDVTAQQGLDSSFFVPAAEEPVEQQALEAAIADESLSWRKLPIVIGLVARTNVYALGEPAGDVSVPGQGTESDLLHFTVDSDGQERVMLPVFTRSDLMSEALARNPNWGSLSVLELDGEDLLRAYDPDVTLVLNPWSSLEFQIPPEARRR
jgi:hypothetical protein